MSDEANVFRCRYDYDPGDPEGFGAGMALVGQAAGGRAISVRAYELPPGQSNCPYHYEYEEEWLLVLDGVVTLRTPAGERVLEAGAVVAFAPGPDGAHRVTGQGEAPARVLMFSSAREPAVAVYPDSDKIGVWPGRPEDKVMLRRGDGQVHYWEGE